MKKLHFIILCFLSTTIYAQLTVSTLTPDISGSGGLSLDADGNLYIADFGDTLSAPDSDGVPNEILKMDADLNLTSFSTGFIGASGNGFDNNGVLYQSDIHDNAIYKVINGVRIFVTSDNIVSPVGIVFDSSDNFFVCNCGNNTIQKVTPDGTSTTFASGSMFACPNGVTIDENDNIYIANFSNTNIVKVTPSGEISIIANTPAGNGHLDYDINKKNLYIASYSGHQIFALNIENPVLRVIAGTGVRGNDDGDAPNATFSTPNGVAVTKTGDSIYINTAVPLSGNQINPQKIRLITGVSSLSADDLETISQTIKVFPIPTKNQLTIEANFQGDYTNLALKIHDVQGRLVQENSSLTTIQQRLDTTVDVSHLTPGYYFYTLSNGTTQLGAGKIVKQ